MAAAAPFLPYLAAAGTIFGGVMKARQTERNKAIERDEKMRTAQINAERSRLETEERVRRKKVEDEKTLSAMRARNFASGVRGTGSGWDFIQSTEEDMLLETDWIRRAGEIEAQDWETQGEAARRSSYRGDYITPFVSAAQWFA